MHCHGAGVPHQLLHLRTLPDSSTGQALLRLGGQAILRGRLPGKSEHDKESLVATKLLCTKFFVLFFSPEHAGKVLCVHATHSGPDSASHGQTIPPPMLLLRGMWPES